MPNMSPRRPTTGVVTAAASRVAVTTQAAFDGEACRYSGSSGTIGMIRVCISEITIPARASTATTAFGLGGPGGVGGPGLRVAGGGVGHGGASVEPESKLLDLGKQISIA